MLTIAGYVLIVCDYAYISILLVTLGTDAVHKIQQQLAGHGLYGGGQGVVMHILGEQVDSQGEVVQGQVVPHMVHQVSQGGVGQGSEEGKHCVVYSKIQFGRQRPLVTRSQRTQFSGISILGWFAIAFNAVFTSLQTSFLHTSEPQQQQFQPPPAGNVQVIVFIKTSPRKQYSP